MSVNRQRLGFPVLAGSRQGPREETGEGRMRKREGKEREKGAGKMGGTCSKFSGEAPEGRPIYQWPGAGGEPPPNKKYRAEM